MMRASQSGRSRAWAPKWTPKWAHSWAGLKWGLGLAAAGVMLAASAEEAYQEDGKLVRAQHSMLEGGAFGDQLSSYSGALSFVQTDVSLPGNFALPVGVSRRLTTGSPSVAVKHFGEWDLELPHLKGVFRTGVGWTVDGVDPLKRCSEFREPPVAANQTGTVTISAQEYWHGNFLNVPGAGEQEMLQRSAQNRLAPQDGLSYDVVTKSGWQIRCLPTLSPDLAHPGEGFVAVSPQGVSYRFDWMVERMYAPYRGGGQPSMATSSSGGKVTRVASSPSFFPRVEVLIYATQVKDRHGNTVNYVFDKLKPWRLMEINASDGRRLTLSYDGDSNRVKTVTAGSRSWQYEYTADVIPKLSKVTLPDGSSWKFSGDALQTSVGTLMAPSSCESRLSTLGWTTGGGVKTMEHPSGLRASFELRPTEHGRSGVTYCASGRPREGDPPVYFGVASLVKKTLSGPGLGSPLVWRYDYGVAEGSNLPCTGNCTKVVTVTNPQGEQTRLTYGTQWSVDEGLLYKEEQGWDGSKALRTVDYRYRAADAGPYPAQISYGPYNVRGDGGMALRHRPLDRKVITQQGKTFTWEATAFDEWARPTAVLRSGPAGRRTELTTYEDKLAIWVTGLTAGLSLDGKPSLEQEHNARGQLTVTRKFGVLQSRQDYGADGTLAWREDGAGKRTNYRDYWRGLPRSIGYADGSGEQAEVDDAGLITRLTDAAGYSTSYGYDSAGRLASITPPAGWTETRQRFERVDSPEYGLEAGHWRQTLTKGNAVTQTYFDAMWRPVLTRSYDASQEASTRRVTVKGYDGTGRVAFESYPQRDDLPVTARSPGRRMSYDALGRLVRTDVDSEQGELKSHADYLDGFLTRQTNARGKSSTQSFWALDNPDEAALAGVDAPEGVSLRIERDLLGKPTSVSRGGVTRRYVYDAEQRLCKTLEPEIQATIQAYDAAGNVAWRAPGQALSSTSSCETAGVADSAKIQYEYDLRNRLWRTRYGDGSPEIVRSYWPDGRPRTVDSHGSSWSYTYNSLRLLSTETLSLGGKSYGVSWSYNPDGHLSGLSYPTGGPGLDYLPNALGEPSRVGAFATELSYHANGAVTGYRLGNGIQHTLTLNTRGLPETNRDAGVLDDGYAYDANGNVTGITDKLENVFSRSMSYDDLDRLKTASAPGVWGTASYSYDAADNLRTANVGSRSVTLNYTDGTNRLNSLTVNGSTSRYDYDPYGNIRTKGGQSYSFDLGNRMSGSSLGGGYVYDGLGRRVLVTGKDGAQRVSVYSQAGQLLWSTSAVAGGAPTQPAYSCEADYLLSGTNCVGPTQTKPATVSTACPNGETLRSGQCVVVKPARLESYCDSGTLSEGQCVVTTVKNYTATEGKACPTGYSPRADGKCTRQVPFSYEASSRPVCTEAGYTLRADGLCKKEVPFEYDAQVKKECADSSYTLRADGQCAKEVPDDYAATRKESCADGSTPVGGQCTVTKEEAAKPVLGCQLGSLKVWPATPSQQACITDETVMARSPTTAATACRELGNPLGAALLGVHIVYVAGDGLQAQAQEQAQEQLLAQPQPQASPLTQWYCGFMPVQRYACTRGTLVGADRCRYQEQQPSLAEYSCPSGGRLDGTMCRRMRTDLKAPLVSYSCPSGGQVEGTKCRGARLDVKAPGSELYCPNGGSLEGSSCRSTKTEEVEPVKTYSCPSGGRVDGTMCRLSETTRSPARTREICEAGYTKEGSSCYKPTGSMPTAQYGCDAGWTQSNGQCSYKAPDKPATVKYVCAGGAVPGPDGQCAGSVQGRAYVYLGGKLIAEAVVGGTTQYVHTDALGSPVARTGPDGRVISRTRFEPYGYVAQGARPSPATSQVGFSGHVQDVETELVYMQQRYYDPVAGRFLSVDPIVTDANTGKGFGLYTYVDNNPYAKIDPDGREPKMGECGYIAALCTTVDFAQSAGRYLRDVGTSMRETSGEITFLSVPAETRESAGYRHHQAFAKAFEPVTQILGALGYGSGLPGSLATGPLTFAVKGSGRSVDALSQAAGAADRGGLTVAGRALQKHGSREGSAFRAVSGRPGAINKQGQFVVDDILTSPGSATSARHHARFGEVTEIRAPDGRGLRYGPDGKFIGFLEPN